MRRRLFITGPGVSLVEAAVVGVLLAPTSSHNGGAGVRRSCLDGALRQGGGVR